MFDPLGSSQAAQAAFGGSDDVPPWPTTPHSPNDPIPNLRRASTPSTPVPPTPDKGPSPGLYGRDPQIYGQPEAGLISPRETVASNGTKFEKPEPYLRVRITGIDRNRRDILIRLDAQTNLSNFTGTAYRNVSRSYQEFQQFYESIVHSNPQTIVPALPLAQTSAPTDEEDDRLVRIMLQRWITRVCEDPILVHDEDLRSFIESDFGYQPTPRPRRKASSGFSLIRRHVPDEDEELQRARFELTKLEGQFFDTAKAIDKLSVARKALAVAHAEMGNKLINVATTEAHPPLGNAFRKIGRTWHSVADLDQAQAISECVIIGDSLGYQGMNARSAKETLQMRTGVLEEYQAAVKTTISKRRNIERLKSSSNIRPDRVDEAIEDMEEANKYEQVLARRADGISQNLHRALQTHNRYANDDITSALIEHARSSIMYERQLLKELEALRVDVSNAANKFTPNTVASRPTVVPKLEEFSRPVSSSYPASAVNGHPRPDSDIYPEPPLKPPSPTQSTQPFNRDPLGGHSSLPEGPSHSASPALPSQASIDASPSQSLLGPQRTLSPSSSRAFSPQVSPSPSFAAGPAQTYNSAFAAREAQMAALTQSQFRSPSQNRPPVNPPAANVADPSSPRLPPQSPVAGPSTPTKQEHNMDSPPLGGQFVDGTKSMFVTKSPSVSSPSPLHSSFSGGGGDPLLGGVATGGSGHIQSPATANAATSSGLDPLGFTKPNMSQSVRVQPTRSRLDAREAASKLANMF